MTAYDKAAATPVIDAGQAGLLSKLPPLVIAGCVLFNFFLCFLNTAGFPISETAVMGAELALVSLAAAIAFSRPDGDRLFWLLLLMAQFVFLALLSVARDEILIRPLRDMMILPVFTALGLACPKTDFTKPLLWLSAFIAAVALFEAFALPAFTSLFNIKEYYIAKGYSADAFQYIDEDVFVSGIRPGGRFFPFPFDIHRISSVFLEPVSLGFYAFISGLYFIAMKNRLPGGQVLLALCLTMFLIWIGDARMAFASLLVVILCRPLFALLGHRLSLLIFPGLLAAGFFIVDSGLFSLDGEGLGARMLWTVERLRATTEAQFFGLRPYDSDMFDSGFLTLLGGAGIGGFLLYWLPPVLFRARFPREARIFWFGASIYLASGLMISSAIFTIKTAALLWFCHGYIIARTREEK